ncbi:MAG TPA: pilus assembly PilX N-terminal domain-containing protein [Candidatus Saccharimonadia bacterium]|nr:pilus assembly PilX N-terminal domain-containing protein [Candidatus Saccharimonadia bacterium]
MSGKKQYNEQGMVSFLVTLIMMLVITLIVVGFSQVTRHNSQEALDRQLSAQAFYSAESGINVTQATIVNYIKTNGTSGLATKTTCNNDYDPTSAAGSSPITPLSGGVGYTCVLVNPTPNSLQFAASQQDSVIMPISTQANLKSLTITWAEQDGGTKTTCSGATDGQFVAAAVWSADCDLGLLRLDIVANPASAAQNATTLANNTISVFLTPRGSHSGSVNVGFGGATTAYIVSGLDAKNGSGVCTNGVCKVTVRLPDNTPNYELRGTTLYKDSKSVAITGSTDSGPAAFRGAQAIVDVTGKDQDELRRVQARVSLFSSGSDTLANAIAGSQDICKHYSLLPTDNVDFASSDVCN